MKRRKIFAGNWKMNKDRSSAVALAREVAAGLPAGFDGDVMLFPPFPFLTEVVEAVSNAAHAIGIGAQNMHYEKSGALTGEVSADMVLSTGARWVLLGHSERRHIFGETDPMIGKKIKTALREGLSPIFCVGEKLEERKAGDTGAVVLRQLRIGLEGLTTEEIVRVVVAYEPVWAIGTGINATPAQAQETHRAIRSEIAKLASPMVAENFRILYGGSVAPANVKELLVEPDIDGVLVGGASLEAGKFLAICNYK
ncbi:MAG: triose-phosphate isomerase [Planctomycetes bacterium]|nr:triose-phosphate isomerase [Planctomycetota bacterium]